MLCFCIFCSSLGKGWGGCHVPPLAPLNPTLRVGVWLLVNLQSLAQNFTNGRYTHDFHENCLIFKTPPPPLSIYAQNFCVPWPWVNNFERTIPTPPPSRYKNNKLWNNNRTVHLNERNQNKNKTKHVTFKLITRSVARFCSQTMVSLKGWLHWLTSESIN